MKAELKQLNKNKQLAPPTIKMEDVRDLVNNGKAIIVNQFINALERSEGKLESSMQDMKVKYDEIKDKYEELKATNEKESQSKKNILKIVMNQIITLDYPISLTYLQDHGDMIKKQTNILFLLITMPSPGEKDHHYHMRIILLGVEETQMMKPV